nr:hypothetical protein [Pseudomonadota bacterium]
FVDNKSKFNYLSKLNIFSAALAHDQLAALEYLCQHQVGLDVMWYAIADADKANKIEFLNVMLTTLVRCLDTDRSIIEKESYGSLKLTYEYGLKTALKRGWQDIANKLIQDRRIDGHDVIGYNEDDAYHLCLQQGWFTLLFEFALNEIRHFVIQQKRELAITIRKTAVGYEIATSSNGTFCNVVNFSKELRMFSFDREQRLFNLLILGKLSGHLQQQDCQTSSLTHFKPAYTELAEFALHCCVTKSHGHEIALALLEKIAVEKNDHACQAVVTKLKPISENQNLSVLPQ